MPRSRTILRPLFLLLLFAALAGWVSAAESEDPADQDERPGIISRIRTHRLEWVAGTDAWLYAGPAAAAVTLQDTRMTPLVYSGFGAGARLSDELRRERWSLPTTIRAHYAFPVGPEELPGTYQYVSAEARSLFLWRIGGAGPQGADGSVSRGTAVGLGGGLRGGVSLRVYDKLQNSGVNRDVVGSVEAGARVETNFTAFKRPVVLHSLITTPVFSYVGRSPAYSLHGIAHYWLAPWQFPRVSFEAGFTWPLKWADGNMVRLWYTWDFYGLDEFSGLQVVRVGTHTLGMALGMKRM